MKYPGIGELDKLVKIRTWSDTPAGFGLQQNFGDDQDVWARIDPAGSALFYGTQQITPGVTDRLATWRTSTVNARSVTGQHVVEHDGMRYRVKRVTDINGRQDYVLMDLELLGVIAP